MITNNLKKYRTAGSGRFSFFGVASSLGKETRELLKIDGLWQSAKDLQHPQHL